MDTVDVFELATIARTMAAVCEAAEVLDNALLPTRVYTHLLNNLLNALPPTLRRLVESVGVKYAREAFAAQGGSRLQEAYRMVVQAYQDDPDAEYLSVVDYVHEQTGLHADVVCWLVDVANGVSGC